jgi:Mrp family chromosome partitioning ATPase
VSYAYDLEGVATDLPPPLLLPIPDATQLTLMLQGDRIGSTAAMLMAARNGEGVSTIARDLGIVSAANGSRTLVLAAEAPGRRTDWPRSVYGISTALRTIDGPPSLEMFAVGESRLALGALSARMALAVPAWIAILTELRSVFDFVLVDAPALERAFTGVMLAPHIDATAIVLAAESTRTVSARALRDRLAEVGATTVGVILNKRRYYLPRAAYDRL